MRRSAVRVRQDSSASARVSHPCGKTALPTDRAQVPACRTADEHETCASMRLVVMIERNHMDPNDVLKKAWAAVENSGVPEHLQETALKAAIQMLSSPAWAKTAPDTPPAAAPVLFKGAPAAAETPATLGSGENSSDDFFKRVARVSDFAPEDLQEVFWLDDGVVHLVPKARDLGDSSADQMRSVALLLTAAYSWGLGASETSLDVISTECRALHCLDSGNFSARVSNFPPLIVTGASRKKVAKTKPATQAAFDKLVAGVIGREAPEA